MSPISKSRKNSARVAVMAAALTVAATPQLRGDEGMWTFDNLPIKLLKERYDFTPTQDWIDHLRLASQRQWVAGHHFLGTRASCVAFFSDHLQGDITIGNDP